MATHSAMPVAKKENVLTKRVQKLAQDAKWMSFPAATGHETRDELEMRRAEREFRTASARRVWTRLSPKDRATLRADVFEQNPFYRERPESSAVEWECIRVIEELLT